MAPPALPCSLVLQSSIGIPQLLTFGLARRNLPMVEAVAEEGKSSRAKGFPSPSGPWFSKLWRTPVGKVSFFRVYSGALSSDTQVINLNKGKTERVAQIYLFRGKNQIPVAKVEAGDIAAVAKLQDTSTGDTLGTKDCKSILRGIEFPVPMTSFAVEPKSKNDEEKVGAGLARFLEEDPTFKVERNAETKQTLIYGMGDTHLEIIVSRLSKSSEWKSI